MDNKIKFLIISAAILIIGGIGLGLTIGKTTTDINSDGVAQLVLNENRFELGEVSMANGLVSHTIDLTNTGKADLKISSIKTSCMCTSAVLKINGKVSPKFSMHTLVAFWSEIIKPGDKAELEIIFDPNAHGPDAIGPITRVVTLLSNDQGNDSAKTKIIFTGDVTK